LTKDINEIVLVNELVDFISDIAILFVEAKKSLFENVEQFYDLERRVVLAAIDELWMNHIDAMSKLREEVAFE
jgi:preprotein translocase subunit SecA